MGARDDEPRFETVWAPDSWPWTTSGPVHYVPVSGERAVLGYLWASEADDAAGFLPAAGAGDDGDNADVAWTDRLRAAKASGLTPRGAIRYWAGRPGDAEHGTIHQGTADRAAGLAVLRGLAART